MAKVFVSYSRRDIEFAKRLTTELQKGELDFWIDWEGIPPTVDWWREIEKGIEEADDFLFLISPDSAKSKNCRQEIDTAVKNGKRIIPVVVRKTESEATPPHLGHLNYIFFDKTADPIKTNTDLDDAVYFNQALEKLKTAIHTDYEWVQQHRWLQVRALDWERASKDSGSLLRGKDLQEAEFQLATNSSKKPHPTDLQREYVFASQNAADRQRRATTAISVVGVIVLAALAVFGFVQAGRATSQANVAQTERAKAEDSLIIANTAKANAESAQSTAVANANAAATSEARAIQSANDAATAKADAENALIRVQSVSELRAQALVSFSQEERINDPALAVLLALEAHKTTANTETLDQLLELLQPKLVMNQFKSANGVYVVSFSHTDDQLAVGYNNQGDIKLWAVSSQNMDPKTLPGHIQPVYGMDYSTDGKLFASGALDNSAILWDAQTYMPIGKPFYASDKVFTVAFSPDGMWMAAGGASKKISIWDTSTRKLVAQLDSQIETVFSLAFSPDGKILASAGKDRKLIFWDMTSFRMLGTPLEKHKNFIYSLAFSPDGKTLVTSGEDGQIIFWNVDTREPLGDAIIASRTNRISTLAFSPDGSWLASGSYDGQVILWDVNTHQQFAKIPKMDTSRVYSVEFSPDGTLLAVGDEKGTVTLWNVQPLLWDEFACEIAGRNFKPAELTKYFPGEVNRPRTCPKLPAGQ